jgi:hypothetical protein
VCDDILPLYEDEILGVLGAVSPQTMSGSVAASAPHWVSIPEGVRHGVLPSGDEEIACGEPASAALR